jgi:hypothetical protein
MATRVPIIAGSPRKAPHLVSGTSKKEAHANCAMFLSRPTAIAEREQNAC